jgi:hypothetical protein
MSVFSDIAEHDAIFGEHPPTSQELTLLAIMRERYTHEQLMSGDYVIPQGHGFWADAAAAGKQLALVIKAAAPFIAMIPGIGTGISMAITAGAGLASGDRIDTVTLNAIETAIPENHKATFRKTVDISYAAARGQRIDKLAIELLRKEAGEKGGPEAQAVFDAGLAVGTGKGLQDAGFKLMGAWVKGDDSASARAIQFGLDVREAAAQGLTVKEFLIRQAQKEFFRRVPAAEQVYVLADAIKYFLAHPEEVVNPQYADLAERLGIPIEAIRAAIICIMQMADGSLGVNPETAPAFATRYSLEMAMRDTVSAASHKASQYLSNKLTTGSASQSSKGTSVIMANTWQSLGKVKIAAGLTTVAQNELNTLASRGARIAAQSGILSAARQLQPEGQFRQGFDIGVGTATGNAIPGSGHDRIRSLLLPENGGTREAVQGFDTAAALAWGITKQASAGSAMALSGNPSIDAGTLVTSGLSNSGLSSDRKASAIAAVASNASTRTGVQSGIGQIAAKQQMSLWEKIKDFFGF